MQSFQWQRKIPQCCLFSNILGYLKSIFRVLTVDGVGGGISGTTNPIEPTERAFDRWHLRLHFCEESVVSQCLC